MTVIYKANKHPKTTERGNKAAKALPKRDTVKLAAGLSRPLKIKYGGNRRFVYVYADVNLDKGLTTIISTKTHEVLGVVKTIERFQFERAVRMIMQIRETYEAMPTLFTSLNEDVIKFEMGKDHFGVQEVMIPKRGESVLKLSSSSNGSKSDNGHARTASALEED